MPNRQLFGMVVGHIPLAVEAFENFKSEETSQPHWCIDYHDARWLWTLLQSDGGDGVVTDMNMFNTFIPAVIDEDDGIRRLRELAMSAMKDRQSVIPDAEVRIWVNDEIVTCSRSDAVNFKAIPDYERALAVFRMQSYRFWDSKIKRRETNTSMETRSLLKMFARPPRSAQ